MSEVKTHVMAGVLAVLAWFLLFSAGVTIDSAPYRNVLAPSSAPAVRSESGVLPAPIAEGLASVVKKPTRGFAFLAVMALFTPLNVALLTMVAGFVGGCASRLGYAQTHGGRVTSEPHEEPDASTRFRTENPMASMMRSFLVYLAFIAGVFITTNEPFANPTPDQYVRLAGLLSFVGFLVGYDPTKFQDILSLKPVRKTEGRS